jgi:hypothetical protein
MAGMPSGAIYKPLPSGIVNVYMADIQTLMERGDNNGNALFIDASRFDRWKVGEPIYVEVPNLIEAEFNQVDPEPTESEPTEPVPVIVAKISPKKRQVVIKRGATKRK